MGCLCLGGLFPCNLAAPARRGHLWQSRLLLQQRLLQHFHNKPLLGANFKHDLCFALNLTCGFELGLFLSKAHLLQTEEAIKEEYNSLS